MSDKYAEFEFCSSWTMSKALIDQLPQLHHPSFLLARLDKDVLPNALNWLLQPLNKQCILQSKNYLPVCSKFNAHKQKLFITLFDLAMY